MGKGIFKRIAVGAMSITLLCGMVTPAFAAEENRVKDTKIGVDEKHEKDKDQATEDKIREIGRAHV